MNLLKLRSLMESYFHQDYDLNGANDVSILIEFADSSHAEDVAATICELDRILAMPLRGIKDRFEESTGYNNIIVGETDAEVHAWLANARATLASR